MFSAFIDKLGGLLPKPFILSTYLPVVAYLFVNGLIVYALNANFRIFVGPSLSLTGVATPVLLLFGVSIVVAYMISTIAAFLREVLEGQDMWWRIGPLRRLMLTFQQKQLDTILTSLREARNETREIAKAKERWEKEFERVAETLSQTGWPPKYDRAHSLCTQLQKLRAIRAQSQPIHYVLLAKAADEMITLVKSGVDAQSKARFQGDLLSLHELIEYAIERWAERETDAYRRSCTLFGQPSLAPTRIGNIAASIQSYAATRYGMDLETLWSRMFVVFQNDDKFYGTLLDAKTQLDFLITSWWLSFLSFTAWFIALAIWGYSLTIFLVLAVVGPWVMWVQYWLIATNYLAFADLVRSGIDLYRFQLLKALEIGLPANLQDEKRLWKLIQRVSAFGETRGELQYEHKTQ